MKRKYLNITVVFEGENLNYGEGFGNVLSLKKVSSRGANYSYVSRQALRYDLVRMLNESFQVPLTDVDKKSGVIQYTEAAKIDEFAEIDLFGYMKTGEGKNRKAVIRLTDAISLEPYNNDLDFSTNKGLADRIKDNKGNDIFQSEFHKSFYSYTITVDLDQIGEDQENYGISLDSSLKANRVNQFLECVKLLHRDIRGKRENLSPAFVIGGLYTVGNPFFYNRVELKFGKDKKELATNMINDILKITVFDQPLKEQTSIGYIKDMFQNIKSIDLAEDQFKDVECFFTDLKNEINLYYKA